MLPKFIEDCNRLLPDGVADSATCMGFCAHSMYHSTMPARELIQKKQWPRNSANLNSLQISCLGSDSRSFLKASSEAKYSFWIKSRTGENTGKISAEQSWPEF